MIQLLKEAGWKQSSGRGDLYLRFLPPGDELGPRQKSLLIPLEPEAPDFPELMQAAVDTMRRLPGDSTASSLLRRLTASPTDQFSFAKETAAPKGWIQWDEGESLVSSARGLLIAGAKTAREPLTYFGNRFGQFANRFLDEVMMGQTDVGSYVVRAYVPVDRAIAVIGSRDADQGVHFIGQDAVASRTVSKTIAQTVGATVEAVAYFGESGSLAAFRAPELRLSYEAVTAVKLIAANSEYANITVSWEPNSAGEDGGEQRFTFTAGDVGVLERGANELVRSEPRRPVSAEGTVHLLSRSEAGGPGVIGITTLTGEPANKLRVRLSDEGYHRAITAHDQGHIVHVRGDLEKESNLAWLYNAEVTGVSEPEARDRTRELPGLF